MKLIILFLLSLPLVSVAADQKVELIGPNKSTSMSVDALRSRMKIHTVSIDDPIYNSKKTFDGFLLSEVLAQVTHNNEPLDEIVFISSDGYSPNMSADVLKKHNAYLVYQEHDKPFEKVTQGKAKLDPGPFYVVWEEGRKLQHEVPWPYQVVKIEAVDFKKKFPKTFPNKATASELKGFGLFKSQCVRCHSINLEGGDVGPELNIPKNITEYWDSKILKEFIRHPSKFRAKSKMPDISILTDADVGDLIAYFKKMKSQKADF
jgi:cytochrome c2